MRPLSSRVRTVPQAPMQMRQNDFTSVVPMLSHLMRAPAANPCRAHAISRKSRSGTWPQPLACFPAHFVEEVAPMSRPLTVDSDGHILEPADLWERYLEP